MSTHTCTKCHLMVPSAFRETHDRYICSRIAIFGQCNVCGDFLPYDAICQHEKIHYDNNDFDKTFQVNLNLNVTKVKESEHKVYRGGSLLNLTQEQIGNIMKDNIDHVDRKLCPKTSGLQHTNQYSLRCGPSRRLFLDFMRA